MTTWTAPQITRTDEPLVADERTMLEGWLDCHRATLLHKCAGLTGEQLAPARRRAVRPDPAGTGAAHGRRGAHLVPPTGRAARTSTSLYYPDGSPDGEFDLGRRPTRRPTSPPGRRDARPARAADAGRSLDDTFVPTRGAATDVAALGRTCT